MSQHEILKFDLNKTYNLTLSFDSPQEYDGKFGKSIMYGAKMNRGEEIRFYASKGLHEEIQLQPGDFPYFIVNGKSKHLEGTSTDNDLNEDMAEIVKIATAPDTIQFDQAWITRIETLESVVETLAKRLNEDEKIPF